MPTESAIIAAIDAQPRRAGDPAREVDDVRRTADAEERPDRAAGEAGDRRPPGADRPEPSPFRETPGGVGEQERPEGDQRGGARQRHQQRHAEDRADQRERGQADELPPVGVATRAQAERGRGGDVEDDGDRQDLGERHRVGQERHDDDGRTEGRDREETVAEERRDRADREGLGGRHGAQVA
jgi:hypothetical protein